MGCLFGAFLSRKEESVWLLDKNKERAHKINEQGIIVEGVSGNWHAYPKVSAEAEQIKEKVDLIIIAVKSYDTHSACASIKPLLSEGTVVLTLQNGMGNIETIGELIGQERVIAGVTNHGVTLLGPGHIRHAGKGETVIGRIDSRMPVELRQIRDVFNQAGILTKISRDIKGLLWSKLIINVGINALSAITRLPNGKLIEFEGTRRILREAVTEAIRIAKRKKIKLIYDDPLAKVEAVCEATANNISSMLQDVLNKKRTEIDAINGVIVRLGQELGIETRVNSVLLDLIKTIEASYNLEINEKYK